MNIVIVDDHPLVRQGLSVVLSSQKDIKRISEAGNVEEAVSSIIEQQPNIVIVDLKLGEESGLEVIEKVRTAGVHCKFLVLTSSVSPDDFRQAKEVGVEGYVLKEALPEELLSALRLINRGRKYYDPGLMELIIDNVPQDDPLKQLTPREREVLSEIGKGRTNKEIAKKLYISEYTVKKFVSQILGKLELADRTQAAIYINQLDKGSANNY